MSDNEFNESLSDMQARQQEGHRRERDEWLNEQMRQSAEDRRDRHSGSPSSNSKFGLYMFGGFFALCLIASPFIKANEERERYTTKTYKQADGCITTVTENWQYRGVSFDCTERDKRIEKEKRNLTEKQRLMKMTARKHKSALPKPVTGRHIQH